MASKTLLEGFAKSTGLVLLFAGTYFVAQAYTMAFHGVYIDCFPSDNSGCGLRQFGEPTLTSVLYGTVLALGAGITFHLAMKALRWTHQGPG